ncbi:MAG: Glu/Leu/Phe/Val dehydrogenase dimerization domain-containing protein [Candidatus Cyclobacteriaceae bacterium M3_2C_046]
MTEVNSLEKADHISIFDEISKLEHEQLVFCHDEHTGLKAIIGVHNTVLGPALGGTRMWNYVSEREAIIDVMRLSRGMTFKAAISGLNIGGGKAVIIGDARTMKKEALMRRFGRFIDSLGGRYVTAEDVNMSTRDMEYIRMETKHVTGLPTNRGGSGDPSPVTAYGVYMGIKACLKKEQGTEMLTGKKIGVQGAGQVGTYLIELLNKENAEVFVTDIFEDKLEKLAKNHKVHVVGPQEIYDQELDIYAPCALGATLNDKTIPRLKCNIVAGGANNQLENEKIHGQMLQERGIIYAPDFLINAGGVMNVYAEYLGNYNREVVYEWAEGIYDTLINTLQKAEKENITPQEAAIKVAIKRIKDIGKVKLAF